VDVPVNEFSSVRALIVLFGFFTFGSAIGFALGRTTSEGNEERARRDVSFLVEACRQGAREVCK
jgi:hypothetical protein